MAKTDIPMRPKDKRRYDLTDREKDCIVWHVLSGCKKEDAYLIFVRPDLAISKQNLKMATSQFFASADVRNFMMSYKYTLNGTGDANSEDLTNEDREKRAGEAVQKFTDKIVERMSGDFESVDEMDAVAKLADRVGVLDDKEKIEEKPRRYLPETCYQGCRYRLFVENAIKDGSVIDECRYCKALTYATDNGYKDDPTKRLSIPKDVFVEDP